MMARRAPTVVQQRGLDLPEGDGLLIDGAIVTRPRASAEAPHLVQRIGSDGRVYETYWQDGVIWPESLLSFDPSPVEIPPRYAPPNPQLDPYEPVALTAREFERRQSAQEQAAAAKAETETRLQSALELERSAARKRRRGLPEPTVTDEPPDVAGAAGEEPVKIYIEDMTEGTDPLERRVNPRLCRELLRLEARSVVGRLAEDRSAACAPVWHRHPSDDPGPDLAGAPRRCVGQGRPRPMGSRPGPSPGGRSTAPTPP